MYGSARFLADCISSPSMKYYSHSLNTLFFFPPACQIPCNILCNSYIQEYKLSNCPVRFCFFLFTFLFEINWTNFLCVIFVEENVWAKAIGGTTWSESLSKLPKTSLNWSRWRAEAWTVVTKWSTITKYFHQYLSKSFQLLLTGSEGSQCCHLIIVSEILQQPKLKNIFPSHLSQYFLDAIAYPSTYPWEWVVGWLIVSHLLSLRACCWNTVSKKRDLLLILRV